MQLKLILRGSTKISDTNLIPFFYYISLSTLHESRYDAGVRGFPKKLGYGYGNINKKLNFRGKRT